MTAGFISVSSDINLFIYKSIKYLLMMHYNFRYPKDWSMPLGSKFSVYGWGHNHRGQLGGVEGNKVKAARLCESFSELNPIQIIGGEQTVFAVTQDGKVKVIYVHLDQKFS